VEEVAGWISSTSLQERLLACWLHGDVYVDGGSVPPGSPIFLFTPPAIEWIYQAGVNDMSEPHPNFKLPLAKRVRERFPVGVDFSPVLFPGDTVEDLSIRAYQDSHRDEDVTASVLEGATLEGNVLKVRLKGGVDEKNYLLDFEATTAGGNVHVRTVMCPVRGA
jgi:hypothetical protein